MIRFCIAASHSCAEGCARSTRATAVRPFGESTERIFLKALRYCTPLCQKDYVITSVRPTCVVGETFLRGGEKEN